MRFRPCIDLHKGKVKQIVGGSYRDGDDAAIRTNFQTDRPSAEFAQLYRRDGLTGGHVIMLGPGNEEAALSALAAWPGGMQLGGGVTPSNARGYLDGGASHVIVTSYVFRDGAVCWDRLDEVVAAVGASRLVLDLSCARKPDGYHVVTDRWQRVSDQLLDGALLRRLGDSCAEFLVHATDIEGKQGGVDTELVALLARDAGRAATYAGGVRSIDDLQRVHDAGAGKVDVTIGSALDIFGGLLSYDEVVRWCRHR
jgi:phosphoribosylformimino-5-aminoimidazole carboxamide ribotide isomerase